MEQSLMRVQSIRVDTHRQLSEHFKFKVQLKEQMGDNEARLHFCRGVISALDEVEKILLEDIAARGRETELVKNAGEAVAMDKPKEVRFPDVPTGGIMFPEYSPPKDEAREFQRSQP